MAVAPRSNAAHDQNFVPTLIGVSTVDGSTPVAVEVDPTTGQMQVSSTGGGGGGGAATIADGADVAEGATTDAIVAAGAAGSVSAKLRRTTQGLEDLKTLIVLAAGANIIGKVGIDQTTPGTTNFVAANLTQINGSAISSSNPLPTTQVAPIGNGFTPYPYINAASTNATNVKASAGDVGGIQVYNNSGVIAYLKLYDKASAPTVGTDVPVKPILIPANTSGAGSNISFASPGISFANGISFAITTGIANTDTGAIASANTIIVNIDYK